MICNDNDRPFFYNTHLLKFLSVYFYYSIRLRVSKKCTLLYNTLHLYCICISDVLEYSSNDIGEALSLERKAFVSLPDTNYSTFLQVVG